MSQAPISKSKKKAQEKKAAQEMARLVGYLSDYGGTEPPQPAEQAHSDNQLKSITTALAILINSHTTGAIVDIGAGHGILLARLVALDAFAIGQAWQYIAVEDGVLHDDVLSIATRHRVHKRVDVIDLASFYGPWRRPQVDAIVMVCRNVLHELSVDATASFFEKLGSTCQVGDTVIIQDLAVFPRAEKGNACWRRPDVEHVIRAAGFTLTSVDDESPTGNRWFNVIAIRTDAASPSLAIVRDLVMNRRTAQWRDWHDLGALHPDDARLRSLQLAKIDFDLQYAGLTHQLVSAGANVDALTPQKERLLAREIFIKALLSPAVSVPLSNLFNEVHHFKDRANSQEALQDFLTSPKAVSVIYGPPLMGKTTLVAHVLATFHHGRLPVFVDVQTTSTVWNIFESLLSAARCSVPIEVLGHLRALRFADVEEPLGTFWSAVSAKVIVAIDHFERLLQPNGDIADNDIAALLQLLARVPGTKIIITSRRDVSAQSLPAEFRDKEAPPVGRFPVGPHVENLLSTVAGITQFSKSLLDAIDRHPHLAYLAALVIRKDGPQVTADPRFLSDVRQRLREDLMDRVAGPAARHALELLSLLRGTIPRSVAVDLSSEVSVAAGESVGLIVTEHEAYRVDRPMIRCLEPLRVSAPLESFDATSAEEAIEPSGQPSTRRREEISLAYLKLYRQDDDPRWLREATYHRMATGDIAMLREFGVAYRSEIFAAGEYWFRRSHDFESALWAFETVEGFGGTSVAVTMRIGSCCLRVGQQQRGDALFADLMRRYPSDSGIKMSYIDALLYVRRFNEALEFLKNAFPEPKSAWPHGQYGRAFMGLHRYSEAAESFRRQLSMAEDVLVYGNLARALHRVGKRQEEHDVLLRGVARYPRSRALRRDLASWKEKNGFGSEALTIFENLVEDASDGWVAYPYVQTLCSLGLVDQASVFWSKVRPVIRPEFLRPVIESHLLLHKGDYEGALSCLKLAGEGETNDEHRDGQVSEIYVAWANAVGDKSEAKRVARGGLRDVDKLPGNVPLLISQSKLAVMAGDSDLYARLVSRIRAINPRAPDLERVEREAIVAFGSADEAKH